MVKAKQLKETKAGTSGQAASPDSDSQTFSTRLSAQQRELLERAAAIRNWSPSNLIRVAAMEKATHILNTSQLTKFDMRGVARTMAKQLFQPDASVEYLDGEGHEIDENHYMFDHIDALGFDAEPKVSSLGRPFLQQLRRAAQLGGAEFLSLLIDECEIWTLKDRADLPEPIEPE